MPAYQQQTLTTEPDPVSAEKSESPSQASVPQNNVSSHGHLWALLGLTILSGLLCFNRLSHPSMLIDECFTYWRTCGTLADLLDTLRNDAFMPLHYELLNWIRQGFPLGFGIHIVPGGILLTPTVMRFVPALCGTAMTPVMYFLARQIFTRRTALIAAAFIACSAYGLFYSRNAKMYAPAWMLATLTIACFLWWIRTGRRVAWLCWIAAGIAAGGFHAITLLLLPLAPLYFVSMGRFRGWRVPMLLLGLATICVAPAVYYGVFNRWTQNSGGLVPGVVGEPAPDAHWDASGLNWLEPVENSALAPFQALNNYLSGYDWATLSDLANPEPLVKKFSGAMIALAVTTYGLLILGAAPWPHLRRVRQSNPSIEPWWRGFLWLTLWLVLPVYGCFYCRSVEDFNSPLDWLKALMQWIGPNWPAALAGAAVLVGCLHLLPKIAKFIAIGILLLAIVAVADTAFNHLNWLDYLDSSVVRLGLLAVVSATIFHYAGVTFRQRSIELLRFAAVVSVVLLLCAGAFLVWRWLRDVSMRKHPELPWQTIWNIRYVAIVWPAVWLAAAALISRLPFRWLRIAAVLMICFYNLANGIAREYASTEVPFDRALADIYSAQPHGNVRTYFDLSVLFHSTYYRPLVSYNACIAAKLEPTPAEFRIKNSWPFEYGHVTDEFRARCVYTPSISPSEIHSDLTENPQVNRVILWEVRRAGVLSVFNFGDTTPDALGSGWALKSDEQITSHWYWTWRDEWIFHRREFYRLSAG